MTGKNVQIERMLPYQIEDALSNKSIVYIPIGTYEWHGEGLPIGLDSIKAHQLCVRAAQGVGGVVCPALYYGTGGEHGKYPWTIMMDDESHITPLLNQTLKRFQDFGLKLAIVFTGHFPGEQVDMVMNIQDAWNNEAKNPMRVLSLTDSMMPVPPIAPDHAAIFETSMLAALEPGLWDIGRLPDINEYPANDPEGNAWSPARHDKSHALYGIFGEDPRNYDEKRAKELLDYTINWLTSTVEKNYPG